MAVLALVKRLSEQTQGSPESNEKIAAALNALIAAFKSRRPIAGTPDRAAKDDQPPNLGGGLVPDRGDATVAIAADGSGAPQPKHEPDEQSPEGAGTPSEAMLSAPGAPEQE
jgi:hypothetical protein